MYLNCNATTKLYQSNEIKKNFRRQFEQWEWSHNKTIMCENGVVKQSILCLYLPKNGCSTRDPKCRKGEEIDTSHQRSITKTSAKKENTVI